MLLVMYIHLPSVVNLYVLVCRAQTDYVKSALGRLEYVPE